MKLDIVSFTVTFNTVVFGIVLAATCTDDPTKNCSHLPDPYQVLLEPIHLIGEHLVTWIKYDITDMEKICRLYDKVFACEENFLQTCPEGRSNLTKIQYRQGILYLCNQKLQEFSTHSECLSSKNMLHDTLQTCSQKYNVTNDLMDPSIAAGSSQLCSQIQNYIWCVGDFLLISCGLYPSLTIMEYIETSVAPIYPNCSFTIHNPDNEKACIPHVKCNKVKHDKVTHGSAKEEMTYLLTDAIDGVEEAMHNLVKNIATMSNDSLNFLCGMSNSTEKCDTLDVTTCETVDPVSYNADVVKFLCTHDTEVLYSRRSCLDDREIYSTWEHCLSTYMINLNSSYSDGDIIPDDMCKHTKDYEDCLGVIINYKCGPVLSEYTKMYNRFLLKEMMTIYSCKFNEASLITLSIIPAVVVCCLLVAAVIIVWRRPKPCPCVKYENTPFGIRRQHRSSSSPHYDSPPNSPYMQLHNQQNQEESSFSFDRLPSPVENSDSSGNRGRNGFQIQETDPSYSSLGWRIGGSTTMESSHDV